MSWDREMIGNALLALVVAGGAFEVTGRRLKTFSEAGDYPAVFIRDGDEEFAPRSTRGIPPKVLLEYEAWVYAKTVDPNLPPATALNAAILAVQQALTPLPAVETVRLGGLVQHCWIEGKIIKDTADHSGNAAAMIPIKILVV